MAYDKNAVKVISAPISQDAHGILLEIATKKKRSKTAQAGYILEQALFAWKQQQEQKE